LPRFLAQGDGIGNQQPFYFRIGQPQINFLIRQK